MPGAEALQANRSRQFTVQKVFRVSAIRLCVAAIFKRVLYRRLEPLTCRANFF